MTKIEAARVLADIAQRLAAEADAMLEEMQAGSSGADRAANIALDIEMMRAGISTVRDMMRTNAR